MAFVRKCDKCGHIDDRQRWASTAEAGDQGAFKNWTCPTCAWTEFELVDESEAPQAETATPR
jgi:predicted nucleic-acid-binding Zn-ribbon protein